MKILSKSCRVLMAMCMATVIMSASAADFSHEGPILLQDVTVIDGLGTSPLYRRDLLIRDGKIARITITGYAGMLPEKTKIIKGKGLSVMPGLMDLHVHLGAGVEHAKAHLSGDQIIEATKAQRLGMGFSYFDESDEGKEKYLNSFLYSGVTTLLEVGGDQDSGVAIRDAINAGTVVGPTLHISGQTINDLQTNNRGVMQIMSEEVQQEIRDVIKVKADQGIRNVKLYAGISPWQARHLIHEAKKYDMTVVADFWGSNLSRDIMEISGLDSYAHGGVLEVSREDARWMAENDKFSTLTLAIFESMAGTRVFPDLENRGYFKNPLVVDVWGKKEVSAYYDVIMGLMAVWHDDEKALYADQLWGNKRDKLSMNMRNAKVLWEEGVQLGMGTDAPWPPGNWPGESMHRELELHVKAGIPPLEAIKMATHNNARYLKIEDQVGSVSSGMVADLLVVKGDPSSDITETRNIVYVIKGGKLLNRSTLKFK